MNHADVFYARRKLATARLPTMNIRIKEQVAAGQPSITRAQPQKSAHFTAESSIYTVPSALTPCMFALVFSTSVRSMTR